MHRLPSPYVYKEWWGGGVGGAEDEARGDKAQSLPRILSAMWRNVDFILETRGGHHRRWEVGRVTSSDLYFKKITLPTLDLRGQGQGQQLESAMD